MQSNRLKAFISIDLMKWSYNENGNISSTQGFYLLKFQLVVDQFENMLPRNYSFGSILIQSLIDIGTISINCKYQIKDYIFPLSHWICCVYVWAIKKKGHTHWKRFNWFKIVISVIYIKPRIICDLECQKKNMYISSEPNMCFGQCRRPLNVLGKEISFRRRKKFVAKKMQSSLGRFMKIGNLQKNNNITLENVF